MLKINVDDNREGVRGEDKVKMETGVGGGDSFSRKTRINTT